MRDFRQWPCLIATALMACGTLWTAAAQTPGTILVDDFESGIGAWSRNDKIATDSPGADPMLVDVIPTKPGAGGAPGSNGAALFAFKSAQNSWASASVKIDGAKWAQSGAQSLTFWLSAGGEDKGAEVVLRGHYRAADGSMKEDVYRLPQEVKLSVKHWRQVVIPLGDFKGAQAGPVLPRLDGVYLLQFIQRGTWSSRFFTIDDIRVKCSGVPVPQLSATPVARPTPARPTPSPTTEDSGVAKVSVDFLRVQGKIRSTANVSLGMTEGNPTTGSRLSLVDNEQFRRALRTLQPRFVRLDAGSLCELVDSSRPAFDFTRLRTAVGQVRGLGIQPLIAVPNPPAWGLDARGYALFAVMAAKAVNPAVARPTAANMNVRYFELATGAPGADDATAIGYFNRARTGLKQWAPDCRVGGIGASAGQTGTLATLLRQATGLDFLSLQYFGARSGEPDAATLLAAATNLQTLTQAAKQLDASRWKTAPIFLTQVNLNGAHAAGENVPSDSRLVRMISAAWWATFLGNASRIGDQIFHNDAANPEWGLLDEKSRAYPAYYALWLWNQFMAGGSQRVDTSVAGGNVIAYAANTASAHHLLVVNTSDSELKVQISIRGFPVLRAVKLCSFDDPQKSVHFEDMPNSPYQTVTLAPYGIAFMQFTEPPRAKS